MPAEQRAAGVGGDVIQLHGDHQIAQITVGVSGIGQKRQVSEHPAEIHEPDNGQCEQLELALSAVAKDRDHQDHGDHEDGQGHEQTVPPGLAVGWIGHQADDARGDDPQCKRSR